MTAYYVAASGDNTTGTSWATAKTTFAAGAALLATGDTLYVDHTHNEELTSALTVAYPANTYVISATNGGTTPTVGATLYGTSTTGISITFTGGPVTIFGLTLKTNSGSSGGSINLGTTAPSNITCIQCRLETPNNNTNTGINIGVLSTSCRVTVELIGCVFKFGANNHETLLRGYALFRDCSIDPAGSIHSTRFLDVTLGYFKAIGCDFSALGSVALIYDNSTSTISELFNCKLGSTNILYSPSINGAEAYLYDCAVGDEHYHLIHENYQGKTIISSSIYANDNIADVDLSWVVTGTNASLQNPYQAPAISVHHTGTSAITPFLEILRNGSSTAYKDNEVWSDWSYKGTSGSTKATIVNDAAPLGATGTNQASGSASWTGGGTTWSGKLAPSSSITPAEAGPISVSVKVAGAYTVYVDPQIRGLS